MFAGDDDQARRDRVLGLREVLGRRLPLVRERRERALGLAPDRLWLRAPLIRLALGLQAARAKADLPPYKWKYFGSGRPGVKSATGTPRDLRQAALDGIDQAEVRDDPRAKARAFRVAGALSDRSELACEIDQDQADAAHLVDAIEAADPHGGLLGEFLDASCFSSGAQIELRSWSVLLVRCGPGRRRAVRVVRPRR